ncbi:hypothetical protein NP493_176g03011 [Ridgeia piscesae]|uniref:Histone acetyltransferase type B catalytic subunit n=1 Tax=Ridgeia piscesae TaxID=27915 RepID=A0AAD9UF98_RIDPI|nr:hypothetical protein NP493_176g03011 [Ridgeia piscesae]
MCHQLFGDSESIFGYKDLRVDIYCTAARMTPYVSIKYSDKVNPERFDGVPPDNIMKILSSKLQPGYLTNLDDFTARIPKDVGFRPFGELMHSYKVKKAGEERCFQVYRTDVETPGFRLYHERLQPFLLFYVDAASYICVDDNRWLFYLIFEKYKSDGDTMYAFAGYMTVYNYYAYPEKVRPRISQVLVMPPFQRQGHGAKLLQTFYNDCYSRSNILDITVEDPSEQFQRLRDFVDARNCLKLSCFAPKKLRRGFSDEMLKEAREKLRLNKKQTRRIYEILRLKATNCNELKEYTAYRIDIKRRLNLPFQKNGREFEKLRRTLKPNELQATMTAVSGEQRLEILEEQYQECVREYMHVLDRIAEAT